MKYKHSHTYYDLKATYKCDLCDNELTSGRSFVEHMKQKRSRDRKSTFVTMNQQIERSLIDTLNRNTVVTNINVICVKIC